MSLPTPCLVVDPVALGANLELMQSRCSSAGVALRPHVKGHKCAWVAARQAAHGASGFAAATLAEAEGLLRAGLGRDVLLTSVVSPRAVHRVVALQQLGDLAVVADDPGFVAALAAAASDAGESVRVFADLDIGQHRSGVAAPARAVELAVAITASGDGVRYAGVQAYEGHLQLLDAPAQAAGYADAAAALTASLDALRGAGHAPPVVTSAGTGTASLALAGDSAVTEIQPGSYALMDATYARTAGGAGHAQAVHLHTTVRSRVGADAVVVDAGFKAVSTDSGPAVVADLEATWSPAGDEHGIVRGDVAALRPGDVVRLVPSHTDTTVALHRALWLARRETDAVALPLF